MQRSLLDDDILVAWCIRREDAMSEWVCERNLQARSNRAKSTFPLNPLEKRKISLFDNKNLVFYTTISLNYEFQFPFLFAATKRVSPPSLIVLVTSLTGYTIPDFRELIQVLFLQLVYIKRRIPNLERKKNTHMVGRVELVTCTVRV